MWSVFAKRGEITPQVTAVTRDETTDGKNTCAVLSGSRNL